MSHQPALSCPVRLESGWFSLHGKTSKLKNHIYLEICYDSSGRIWIHMCHTSCSCFKKTVTQITPIN